MMPLFVDKGMGKEAGSEENPKELQAPPPAVLKSFLHTGKWRSEDAAAKAQIKENGTQSAAIPTVNV